MAKYSLSIGDDAQHGSFVLNYTGQKDWGVSCKDEGPYPKRLPKHTLPHS